MERFALLVDAGYFFAAGAEAAFGSGVPRREIRLVDPERAIQDLHEQAAALCGDLQLLRVYWYDAMPGPSLLCRARRRSPAVSVVRPVSRCHAAPDGLIWPRDG